MKPIIEEIINLTFEISKVDINKFDFISSVRRLIYFKGLLLTKEKKEINQKSLISKVKI